MDEQTYFFYLSPSDSDIYFEWPNLSLEQAELLYRVTAMSLQYGDFDNCKFGWEPHHPI